MSDSHALKYMRIKTTKIDSDTLSSQKEVTVESTEFETPAKALQVGKLRASETVSPLARGVVEIYRKADAAGLNNSRQGWEGLAKNLDRQAKNARDDEFVVPFIEYEDTDLNKKNAAEIARLQTNYGDIITVPLMTSLVNAADDGDDRTASNVSTIIENTRSFLDAVGNLGINKPVMGVIPLIGEDCTQALVDLYFEYNIRAYCVDYNRRSPMARFQINNVVSPLMQSLTNYDIREESLIYAVNAKPHRSGPADRRTPDTMYGYTLGFDIVGDNHIAPKLPEEVLEKLTKESGEEAKLRLFDSSTVSIVEVSLSDLDVFLPKETDTPVDRVRNRVRQNQNEKYRFEKLINAELISLYLESEGGVDPAEIYVNLKNGAYAQDSDLERVEKLASEV